MFKTIQIRNVPEALHQRLKARSAAAGMSLSNFLLAELGRSAELPTIEELRARLDAKSKLKLTQSPEDVIRNQRDRR